MDLSLDDKIRNEQQFDSYIKMVLRNYARDLSKKKKRQREMEEYFSDISDVAFESANAQDCYPSECNSFRALDYQINIESDVLADALRALHEKKRTILLLFYGAELTDVEIGNCLLITPCNIKMARLRALDEIKKYMGD